jgi:two-component sensor histidine kinase
MMRLIQAVILCFCFAFSRADIGDGLVARYNFNQGNKDEVSGREAKVVEAFATEDRFGNPRSAYFLLGNLTSYISLGTSSDLKPRCGSVSLWLSMERLEPKGKGYFINPIILTKNKQVDDFYEGYGVGYDYSMKKLTGGAAIDSTQQVSVFSKGPISLHKWYHIVIAYDDHHMWFYLNGEVQSDGEPLSKNFVSEFSPTDSVVLGNSANKKNDRAFCGSLDDVCIYNRVLSPTEVKALYQEPDYNRYNLYLKWFVWVVSAVAVVVALRMLWLRKDLRTQKEKNRVSARLNELETKAVRMQMNPHFIFNSLNTLQHFILEENFQKSNLYLVKLSKLLRRLLESSISDFISLSEETDILASYLEIESMRFDNSFRYEIKTEVQQPDAVYIPFMLIQPFVENAIWHGLLPKKGDRSLTIRFSEPDPDRILCEVEDNGLGRQDGFKGNHAFKRKSLGVDFIKQRLELLEKSTGIASGLEIIDRKDEEGNALGTQVKLLIPKLKYENTHDHY